MDDAQRATETHAAAVHRAFAFMKAAATVEETFVRGLPLPGGGHLVPVAEVHADDAELHSTLSAWRSANAFAFPTRFPVTEAGTARWLRVGLLDVADRILFLVLDRHGRRIGHLGLGGAAAADGSCEIDNVVRGVAGAPGLMSDALRAVCDWAERDLGASRVFLRVLDENAHAITFYERLGFVAEDRIPLTRIVDGDRLSLVEAGPGDPADEAFLRMGYSPDRSADATPILTAGPSISAREASYTLDAARNGWNGGWNGYIQRFERAFADYVGVEHAIATSSCTGALHIALAALGIGPGDEVIVPDITWVATANAVSYVGATPVFCDVEEGSWCMSPESFASLITPATKAVMPVALYGHPARLDEIVAIARAHGLRVVEDAAPGIGAEWNGRRVGSYGDVSAFSFQGAKLLVTGEGGMLVTNDPEIRERAYAIWDQGREPGTFWIRETGWKYKISNVQAAIGLGQIERCDELVEAKRRIHGWYAEGLAGVDGIELQREELGGRSIYWMSNIRVRPEAGLDREALRAALRAEGIDTRPVFPTISQYPMWPRRQAAQPIATAVAAEGINLPSGVRLRRDEIERTCRAVRKAVAAHARLAA
jgi:perosamine synthetase